MQCRRAGFLLVFLLLAGSLAADSVQHSLVFQSLHQSIWGPGGTPPATENRFYIINPNTVSWNASTSGYPDYVGSFDSVAGADFGAGGRAKSSGEIGLWVDLKLKDLGSVDVTYPVTPRVEFPDMNSFRAGDTIAIHTSYATNNGWQMSTTSPQFAVEMDAKFRLYAEASGRLCVFDCTNVAPVPAIDINPGEFNIFTIQPGSSVTTPPWLGLPVSATIGVPNIQTVASLDGNGRSLVSGDTDSFLSLTLDLAGIAFDAARSPIDPSFSTDDLPGFSISGLEFHYNIVKVEPTVELSARQNFRFDPNLRLALRFAKPLEHWVVSNGAIGPTSIGSVVEVTAGDTVYVRYPSNDKQPTSVGPTFRLANTFSSATGFDLEETLHVSAGEIGLRIPSFTIIPEICFGELGCTPALEAPEVSESLGPLYSHDELLGEQDLGNIFSGSWEMQGFAPVMVDAFALDPENPIILIDQQTGATRNLGGGRRQVAYAIDFSNGGDVKLSDVHLMIDLAAAFGAAHSFQVDQVIACDIAANPNFDGAADKQLLEAGASLEVAAKARIILIVSVYPKPDPPVYTATSVDDGTSQLGTFVTATDSSAVLLGPGVINALNDYVLFADHDVKLDSIANSFGHIGANDFIEVKNGNSAVLAGDLRAARTIKVQGEITADYAISGGGIDVVKKAKLNLSGNMKSNANVPVYTVSAPQPASALSGNVWVPDNMTDALQPGNYGDVTINRGGTLSLAPGTYWFARLSMADNASLRVRGSSRGAVIHVMDPGEIRVGQGANIRGILNAPRANVTFEERSRLEGSAAAKSITLRPGASASYHRDCDRLVDPDCDGSPSCGQ